jgi:hypothetical protein
MVTFKTLQEMNEDANEAKLVKAIRDTLNEEDSQFPAWISNISKVSASAGKLASDADDMKFHLRHIVLPHALQGFRRLRSDLNVDGSSKFQGPISNDGDSNHANNNETLIKSEKSLVSSTGKSYKDGDSAKNTLSSSKSTNDDRVVKAPLVPAHTTPVVSSESGSKAMLKKFFEGVRDGRTGNY